MQSGAIQLVAGSFVVHPQPPREGALSIDSWKYPNGYLLSVMRRGMLFPGKSGGWSMYLSNESIIVILVVGLVAGWLAGKIVEGTGFGLIGDLAIGIVGAFIASWLLPRLGIGLGVGIIRAIINSTIGAVLLLVIVRLVKRGGRW